MTDLTDIEFDRKAPAVKQRRLNQGVTYTQNGVVFSAGYVPLFFEKTVKEMPKPEIVRKKKKKRRADAPVVAPLTARERAADKLRGFKESETPDAVKTALTENARARAAEENN